MTDDRSYEAAHTFGGAEELRSNDDPVAGDKLGTAA
jgi:hypothetical protein